MEKTTFGGGAFPLHQRYPDPNRIGLGIAGISAGLAVLKTVQMVATNHHSYRANYLGQAFVLWVVAGTVFAFSFRAFREGLLQALASGVSSGSSTQHRKGLSGFPVSVRVEYRTKDDKKPTDSTVGSGSNQSPYAGQRGDTGSKRRDSDADLPRPGQRIPFDAGQTGQTKHEEDQTKATDSQQGESMISSGYGFKPKGVGGAAGAPAPEQRIPYVPTVPKEPPPSVAATPGAKGATPVKKATPTPAAPQTKRSGYVASSPAPDGSQVVDRPAAGQEIKYAPPTSSASTGSTSSTSTKRSPYASQDK